MATNFNKRQLLVNTLNRPTKPELRPMAAVAVRMHCIKYILQDKRGNACHTGSGGGSPLSPGWRTTWICSLVTSNCSLGDTSTKPPSSSRLVRTAPFATELTVDLMGLLLFCKLPFLGSLRLKKKLLSIRLYSPIMDRTYNNKNRSDKFPTNTPIQSWRKSNHIFNIRAKSISTHDARPTRKYKVNKQATNISRWFPIRGNSSLSAVIIASDPPNWNIIKIIINYLLNYPDQGPKNGPRHCCNCCGINNEDKTRPFSGDIFNGTAARMRHVTKN
ncbi:Protein of unknown function [Cotesia congregata]|uniref:Uncharacterized protein n=1 Tax=Cotesia congregata TaxID=51543 RepID=A0A8J2H9S9_COTCN|nr:Protein of unknown function [Cotesia congregata]